MNRNISFYFLASLMFFSLFACKKSGKDENVTSSQPLKTEKGTAVGIPSTKLIGTAGGELISPDGKLKLTVAPGTVSANILFSIQQISNTLYERDATQSAYRLLPEGITFAKPVQLTFTYAADDYKASAEEAMTVAWQQANGTWKIEPTKLNTGNKTLITETTHFSDWTKTGGFFLSVEKDVVRPSEKAKLILIAASDDDLLAPVSITSEDRTNLTALGNWKIVQGNGTIEPVKNGSRGLEDRATYTAPSTVNGVMNVVITVEVEGFNRIKDPAAPGGVRRTGKMILFGRLLVSDDFIIGTLDGVPFGFFGNNAVAVSQGGLIGIRGSDGSGEVMVSVNGNTAGSYPCGQIIQPGTAGVSIAYSAGAAYRHVYIDCGPLGEQMFSPSPVTISKWPAVGQQVEGSFSGPVYLSDGVCGARQKSLELRFSITRLN